MGAILNFPAAAWRAAVARRAEALCVCLLLVMAFNLLAVISRKGLTADEFYHIPAGYYHLTAGDFHLNTEHPPLVKMYAALPLLLVRPEAPRPDYAAASEPRRRTEETLALFWRANTARFETVSFWPRVPMVFITLALGWLVFVYARQLFGARAALFAVALYALEPTVLAHGRVIQTDVPAAFSYLLFFYALHAYARKPSARRALGLGAALGLALVTKFSLVVLAPVFAASAVALVVIAPRRGWRRGPVALQAGAAALVALFVVNAAYYFQGRALLEGDLAYVARHTPGSAGEVVAAMRALSALVPTSYLFGVYQVAIHNRNGHLASVFGRYGHEGWWLYFPAAFALKTTLPFLATAVAALAWAARRLFKKREWRMLAPLAPVALYALLAMSSRINIGVRHFLPVFPFLFILGGALLDRLLRPSRGRRKLLALVVVLVCWVVFEAARAFPHYVPYMNQLAWRRPHWYYLTDSNVEWGDDARALALYLRARGETRVRAALLDGITFNDYGVEYARTLDHYGVEYVNLVSAEEPRPETRYVAVGASYLNGALLLAVPVPQRLKVLEFRRRTPEAVFGNSIYLYRVAH
jgi:4-amino-4-deoxy-L-arabinose transferase-like glycosyltransferase